MDTLNYGPITAAIIAWSAVQLLAGGLIGRVLHRPWLEGQAMGLLVLVGACDLALYAARATHAPQAVFAGLCLLAVAALTWVLRWAVFTQPVPKRDGDRLVWPMVIGFSVLIVLVRLMTPDPQAGYVIYQAFNPLYLEASLRAGFFLLPEDTFMGPAFITTGQIAYPPDTLGLAALCHWLAGGAHAAYFASTMTPTIAVIGLMTHGLRRSRLGLLAFAALMLLFLRYGTTLRLLVLDNWIDVTLYFAGMVTVYYLVAGENRRVARLAAGFASTFMVFARPYGALYSAVILVVLFACEMADPATRRHFRYWFVCGLTLTLFTLRELVLVALNGIYYARPTTLAVTPPDWAKSISGTIYDWGLAAHESHFALPFPKALPAVLALGLLVVVYRRGLLRHPRRILPYLAPLLLLLAPLITEAVTGFRKGPFSKLYIVAVVLFPWYPAYLLSRLPVPRRFGFLHAHDIWAGRLAWGGLGVAVIVGMGVVFGPTAEMVRAKIDRIVWTYRANNSDLLIARGLTEKYGAEIGTVANRKVMYIHTEPGVGLRYFLGGDLFSDMDFWSERVQNERMRAADLPALLTALGCPNVYVSYPGWRMNGRFVSYTGWEPFGDQIDAMAGKDFVAATITDGSAKFHVTRCAP